jgi:mannose-1-phosphate guanylyltransferase
VIVQAENRGTGVGILLSLLHIMARDPGARVVLLPSDHHVRYEAVLTEALGRAIQEVQSDPERTVLLGMQPEDPDPDLGYLVPEAANGHDVLRIERFVEKPPLAVASELVGAGALWNTFIVVASAEALLGLFRTRFPEIVIVISAAFDADCRDDAQGRAVAELYESLPVVDLSRDILAEQVGNLRVLPVSPCGWSDLGTPKRVSAALREGTRSTEDSWVGPCTGYISLAAQHERLGVPV